MKSCRNCANATHFGWHTYALDCKVHNEELCDHSVNISVLKAQDEQLRQRAASCSQYQPEGESKCQEQ